MRSLFSTIGRFLSELRRRNVYRVAVTYVVVGFFVIEGADLVLTRLGLPPWTVTFVIVLVGLGFPIALVLAWALEMTPKGVRVEESASEEEEVSRPSSTPRDLWVGASVLAVLLFAGSGLWYMNAGDETAKDGAAAPADTVQKGKAVRSTAETRPRVAVLPFENIARDSSDAFFARGLHEEVLNQLAKVSGLEVISRTSVQQYAQTEKTVQEISRELGGISALVEGTVRRAAGRVRITAQLIEAPEDEHLWSKTYARALSVKQIFEVQADIAEQIAAALETELAPGERRRIEEVPTSDLAAYDAFLRGRSSFWRTRGTRDPRYTDRAIEALREAANRDSAFAEARAWLGLAYRDRHLFTGEERWLDSARAAVNRAYALDSESAAVLTARGALLIQEDSLEAARSALRRALELQPNDGFAVFLLSELSERSGAWIESVRWAHRLVTLEPRSGRAAASMGEALGEVGMLGPAEAWWQRLVQLGPSVGLAPLAILADVHLLQGEIGQARAVSDSALALRPDHPFALQSAGRVALHAGAPDKARKYLRRIPEARRKLLSGSSLSQAERGRLEVRERALLGLAELRLGREERGRARLQAAADTLRALVGREQQDRRSTRLAQLGGILAALGQREESLRVLERAAEAGFPLTQKLETHPFYDSLRSDARFQELLGRVEANQQRVQEEVRRMGIPVYPPRMKKNEGPSEEGAPTAQP